MVRIPPFFSNLIGGGPCSILGGCKSLLIPIVKFFFLFLVCFHLVVKGMFFSFLHLFFYVSEQDESFFPLDRILSV